MTFEHFDHHVLKKNSSPLDSFRQVDKRLRNYRLTLSVVLIRYDMHRITSHRTDMQFIR
jgi:hypothetical protein